MENWQRNLDAIARGKGSPQARDEGCQMCNEEKDQTETEQDKLTKKEE